jgi:hypothetical protein
MPGFTWKQGQTPEQVNKGAAVRVFEKAGRLGWRQEYGASQSGETAEVAQSL